MRAISSRPLLTLLTGTTAAQAVVFAARPVVTRLYDEAEIGLLTFVVGWSAVLSTVAAGRYEDALMLPEDEAEAANLAALSALLAGAASALCLLLWFGRDAVQRLFPEAALGGGLAAVPLAVALMSWMRIAESWHTRARRFSVVSGGRIGQSAATVTGQVGGGAAGGGAGALIGGMLAGYGVGALALTARALRAGGPAGSASWRGMARAARRYRRFALFSTPAALLKSAASRLPVLLIPAYFALDVLGQFGLGYGVLALPVGIVGGSIGQWFFSEAALAHRAGTLAVLTASVFRRLVLIGLFPTLALAACGPEFFALVFGAPWRTAGVFVQLLAPWIFLQYLTVPLTYLFDVLERQRSDLAFGVLLFAGQLAALVAGGRSGDPILLMGVFGLVAAGLRLLHLGWLLRLGRVPLRAAAGPLLRFGLYALPCLLPILLARPAGSPLLTTLAAAAGAVLYAALTRARGEWR